MSHAISDTVVRKFGISMPKNIIYDTRTGKYKRYQMKDLFQEGNVFEKERFFGDNLKVFKAFNKRESPWYKLSRKDVYHWVLRKIVHTFLDLMLKDLIMNNEVFVIRNYGFIACSQTVRDFVYGNKPKIIFCKCTGRDYVIKNIILLGKYRDMLQEEIDKGHKYETIEKIIDRYNEYDVYIKST